MRKFAYILTLGAIVVWTMVGCSTQKNTSGSRWWHSFNARYNIYYNGKEAFTDGNLEKEKGNRDNFTEQIPLYMVGNKQSRSLGSGQYPECYKAKSHPDRYPSSQ